VHIPSLGVWTKFALGVALLLAVGGAPASAQSIEPRAYSPAPVGTNFVVVALSRAHGPLETDPAAPISDIHLRLRGAAIGYVRSLNLWGKSAKFDVIVPYGQLVGDATFRGIPFQRRVSGFADPAVRLTILVHGAPALSPVEFQSYHQDVLIGVSVQATVPVGRYARNQLLNLSTNRWSIKPEVGGSKTWGRWTIELAGGATIYGTNREFLGSHTRSQKPIYAIQSHLIYNVAPGAWLAANASYFTGGENRIDDLNEGPGLQKNWRVGLIAAMPVTRRTSLKFSASKGVSARTGNKFELISAALQYHWVRGL
jgi:hypothetical protein